MLQIGRFGAGGMLVNRFLRRVRLSGHQLSHRGVGGFPRPLRGSVADFRGYVSQPDRDGREKAQPRRAG